MENSRDDCKDMGEGNVTNPSPTLPDEGPDAHEASTLAEADPTDAEEIKNLDRVANADKIGRETPAASYRPAPHFWIPAQPVEVLSLRTLNQSVVGMYDPQHQWGQVLHSRT